MSKKLVKIDRKDLKRKLKKDEKRVGKVLSNLNKNKLNELLKISQVTELGNNNFALEYYKESLIR